MTRSVSLLILATILLAGCKSSPGENGFAASARLGLGMTRVEALKTLAKGGQVEVEKDSTRPESGDWTDIVHNTSAIAALKQVEQQRGPVHRYLRVNRRFAWEGLDEFHLFFDSQDKLIGHWMKHYE